MQESNADRRVRQFQWAIKLAFLAATLIFAVALIKLFQTGLNIDTNLRSLAPQAAQDSLGEQLINQLSGAASRKAIVVLASENPAKVSAASDAMRTRLGALAEEQNSVVRVADMTDTVEQYVRLLEQYPYNFLSPQLRPLLEQKDDAQLTQWVVEKLFSGTSQVRLTGFDRDPFGALNDYAFFIQERLAGDNADDIRSVLHEGVEQHFSVWQFELPADGMAFSTQEIWIEQLSHIQTEITQQFPEVRWLQSGMIFFAADSAQSAQKNINMVSNTGAICIILLMLAIFRGIRPLAGSMLSIIGGVSFAFVISHSLWNSLHILTLLFGASLIGVAVDYSLHLYYFHLENKSASQNHSGHRWHFYRALILSLLTSIVGYGALAMSGLETLRQVALFSIAGLVYACLLVLMIEPWSTKKLKSHDRFLSTLTHKSIEGLRFIGRVPFLVVFAFAVWGIVLLLQAQLKFDDSPKAFIKQNQQLFDNERIVNAWISDYEPATFVVVTGANAQEIYDKIASLHARWGDVSHSAKGLLGIDVILPSPREQAENYALNAALYTNKQLANALVEDYEITTGEHLSRIETEYRNWVGKILTPADLLRDLPGFPQLWLEGESLVTALLIPKNTALDQLRNITAEIPGVELVSMVEQTEEGLHHLRTTAGYYLFFALLLITFIFFCRHGWRLALILSLVPAAVLGCIALIYLLANVPITLFHVMAAFLVLGLGVDYLVFASEMVGSANASNEFANALVLSAATSILSFGVLGLTVLPAVQAFGMTAALGILGNLIGAFWLIAIWRNIHDH